MSNVIKFSPIERPPAYGGFSVCDPSQLEGRDVPDREWLVENLIPAGKVVLFTGDGGVGKSLAMQQLCTATALGQDWFGIPTQACRSLRLFCEDDDEELHRRQADICAHTMTSLWELWRMRWLSGVGLDNTLMQFDQRTGDAILTPLFHQLLEFWGNFKPGLVVVDTLADTFGGNEIIRNQVRTFINGCLGRICEETRATVVLCGHPSRASLKDGDGYSGSTAWHASVRARLYLSKPDDEDAEPVERNLSTKKNNYGPTGEDIEIRWDEGLFVPVQKFGGMVGKIEKNKHEKSFLKCLDALATRGSTISESKNSATYAPKVMALMPERDRVRKRDLEKAMFALCSSGEIINEQYGPPSRLRRRIARKLVEGENDA